MSSLIEIVDKFNNGRDRYTQDPNFANAVNYLRFGVEVYEVLDYMLNQLRVLQAMHAQAIEENKQLVDDLASYSDALELSRQSRKL